jgi:hypothetical protein
MALASDQGLSPSFQLIKSLAKGEIERFGKEVKGKTP